MAHACQEVALRSVRLLRGLTCLPLEGVAALRDMEGAALLDIPLIESIVPREMLYIADEVFFSGTAAEITPIRSIDRIQIGKGRRGPVAERLQKEFFAIVNGSKPDRHAWLSPVAQPEPSLAGKK